MTKETILSKSARAAAKAGFIVFPVRRGAKTPAIKDWQRIATRNAKAVKRLWTEHPGANVGVLTGRKAGLFVLDVDGQEGRSSLEELNIAHGMLPQTVTVRTPRGRHYYFRSDAPLRNNVRRLGPGLDGRGEGGYVVGAGSVNGDGNQYRYTKGHSPDEVDIASVPDWLKRLLNDAPIRTPSPISDPKSDARRAYAAAALQREANDVRGAVEGRRNHSLNTAAFSMGQLIAEGAITRAEVENSLISAALAAGLELQEIRTTLASGFRAGLAQPRDRQRGRAPCVGDPVLAELAQLGETDTDNARRLVTRYSALLQFVPERKQWYTFDGRVWHEDAAQQRLKFAQESARLIASEAELLDGDERRADRRTWAQQSLSAGAVKRALEMAQPHATRPITDFDADPWLFNATNGTLDLRTGKLRAFASADHLTALAGAAYERDAKCIRFKQFVREIFAGDKKVLGFVQRFAGYSLTGSTTEQCFLFLQGAGGNGKSTLIQILQQMLGDYARSTPTETLLAKHAASNMSNDLARLKGARMVAAIESNPNRQLDEALIKQITGGDRITARFMYGEYFEYMPELKLWFVANHPPRMRSTDNALWRRILVLPFDVTIAKEQMDPDLLGALQAEIPGILAWAVRGCRRWQQRRLKPPAPVLDATRRYRKEVDHFRRFLQECVTPTDTGVIRTEHIYDRYERWCTENGEHQITKTTMGKRLTEAGYEPARLGGGCRAWRGLKLRE